MNADREVKSDYIQEKEEWRKFCETESSITLYQQPWYWDAACDSPEDWRVILIKKDGKIEAAFPFVYMRRKFMWFIEAPWVVPASGIWMRKRREDFRSIEADLMYLKEIVNEVVDRLPYFDRFQVGFNSRLWSWQPFYWRGFEAWPHYTTVILPVAEETIKAQCSKSRRRRLNKAEREYRLELNTINAEQYWRFFEKTYNERGKTISFSKEKFLKLFAILEEHNALQVRTVAQNNGEIVAQNIVLMDNNRYYHHFVAQVMNKDKEASALSVYDSICTAMREEKMFDFEGSMIFGVAKFNISFNPRYESLFVIIKESTKYKFINGIRQAIFALRDYVRGE